MVVDGFALEWLKQGDKFVGDGELAYTRKAVDVDDRESHYGGFIKEVSFQDRKVVYLDNVPRWLLNIGY